jgi:hypothetical protein
MKKDYLNITSWFFLMLGLVDFVSAEMIYKHSAPFMNFLASHQLFLKDANETDSAVMAFLFYGCIFLLISATVWKIQNIWLKKQRISLQTSIRYLKRYWLAKC